MPGWDLSLSLVQSEMKPRQTGWVLGRMDLSGFLDPSIDFLNLVSKVSNLQMPLP